MAEEYQPQLRRHEEEEGEKNTALGAADAAAAESQDLGSFNFGGKTREVRNEAEKELGEETTHHDRSVVAGTLSMSSSVPAAANMATTETENRGMFDSSGKAENESAGGPKKKKMMHDEGDSVAETLSVPGSVSNAAPDDESGVVAGDRGGFGFSGEKEEGVRKLGDEEVADMAPVVGIEKAKVSEPEVGEEEQKLDDEAEGKKEEEEEGKDKNLQRSGSTSSGSGEEDGGEEKKGMKEKIKEMISGEDKEEEEGEKLEIEKLDKDVEVAELNQEIEEKGFIGTAITATTNTQDAPSPTPQPTEEEPEAHAQDVKPKEKKGIFEKIKEKMPGFQAKLPEEKRDEKATY